MNKQQKTKNTEHKTTAPQPFYGKLPPQAKDLEEAVLGAVMLDKWAFDTAIEILQPECFYSDAHQRIYRACMLMHEKGTPIDLLTVIEQLKTTGELEAVGGPYFISTLTNKVVSTAHLEAHCRIVLQKHIKRQLINVGSRMVADAYADESDVFDLLDETESAIFTVSNAYLRKDYAHILQVGAKVLNRIDALRAQPKGLSGITSGFAGLDRITNGWQPTDLIVLAARPSVGKTAFALNLARNAASHAGGPVAVGMFSLEMSAQQLVQRILSAQTEVPLQGISQGRMSDGQYLLLLNQGIKRFETLPIYIDDTAALNIFEFRAKARRMVTRHKVGMLIIDYLQLMGGIQRLGGNREQEISSISRSLKGLAKELGVPIIALSQLSRAVETRRESKVPQLSDLRESGAIEQDADMVMFIYRPEYHGNTTNEHGESTAGETYLKIAKHRNGALGTVKLRALLHIQKFEEVEGGAGFASGPSSGGGGGAASSSAGAVDFTGGGGGSSAGAGGGFAGGFAGGFSGRGFGRVREVRDWTEREEREEY